MGARSVAAAVPSPARGAPGWLREARAAPLTRPLATAPPGEAGAAEPRRQPGWWALGSVSLRPLPAISLRGAGPDDGGCGLEGSLQDRKEVLCENATDVLDDSSSSRLEKQRSCSASSRKPKPQPKATPEMSI